MKGIHNECENPDTCLCAESHGKTELEKKASEQFKQMLDDYLDEISIQKLDIDNYQRILAEKQKTLEKTIEVNFQGRSFILEICLSVKAQLKIEDLTQPFALILMGNPSTHKTTILEIVNSLPGCYKSDKFTPKSFVSHSANTKKEELHKIDLLPRIKHKTLITPELAPLFSGNEEHLVENFGILTRVLDGVGLEIDSGVHGKRGYSGDYYFMILGAVVDIPHKVWKILGNLGPRLYFLRLPDDGLDANQKLEKILDSMKSKPYQKKISECKKVMLDFWTYIENRPGLNENHKIVWNKEKDDNNTIRLIIKIATLLSKLRASIPSWQTSDSTGTNYNFEMPTIEEPSRASNALYNLARGHAVICGRDYITNDDLTVVIPVALSSAARERVALFKLILENGGKVDVEKFVESSGVSSNTARKEMRKLSILELVDEYEEDSETKPKHVVCLKKEFEWFLSSEFNRYWERFSHKHTPKFSALSSKLRENAEKNMVSTNQQTLDSQILAQNEANLPSLES